MMFVSHQRKLHSILCCFIAASAVAHGEAPASDVAKPRATFTTFTPHYLCLCAPYCRKLAPAPPCFCLDCTCDIYCRKPLPAPPCPCTPCTCDNYCRKPLPGCLPAPLCGPREVCRDPGVCPLQIP